MKVPRGRVPAGGACQALLDAGAKVQAVTLAGRSLIHLVSMKGPSRTPTSTSLRHPTSAPPIALRRGPSVHPACWLRRVHACNCQATCPR